jgi:hypothetical protein
MKITQIDAATGSNEELTVTQAEFTKIIGEVTPVKSMAEVIAENKALKDAAIAKLAALGLTIEEAQLILGGSN